MLLADLGADVVRVDAAMVEGAAHLITMFYAWLAWGIWKDETLLRLSGPEKAVLPAQFNRRQWPAMKERLAALLRTKTRDESSRIMEGSAVCFAAEISRLGATHAIA